MITFDLFRGCPASAFWVLLEVWSMSLSIVLFLVVHFQFTGLYHLLAMITFGLSRGRPASAFWGFQKSGL